MSRHLSFATDTPDRVEGTKQKYSCIEILIIIQKSSLLNNSLQLSLKSQLVKCQSRNFRSKWIFVNEFIGKEYVKVIIGGTIKPWCHGNCGDIQHLSTYDVMCTSGIVDGRNYWSLNSVMVDLKYAIILIRDIWPGLQDDGSSILGWSVHRF